MLFTQLPIIYGQKFFWLPSCCQISLKKWIFRKTSLISSVLLRSPKTSSFSSIYGTTTIFWRSSTAYYFFYWSFSHTSSWSYTKSPKEIITNFSQLFYFATTIVHTGEKSIFCSEYIQRFFNVIFCYFESKSWFYAWKFKYFICIFSVKIQIRNFANFPIWYFELKSWF